MTPNKIAAPINADTILIEVYTLKAADIDSAIKPAKLCNANVAPAFDGFELKNGTNRKMAPRGAKRTTHLRAVPNNTAMSAGDDATKDATTILVNTAKNM